MANSILGAGIIGLPYAISRAGFVMGIFLLVTLAGVTDWTIRLVVLNAKLSGRESYTEVMHYCFGHWGSAGVSFFQFAFAFGGYVLPYHPSLPLLLMTGNESSKVRKTGRGLVS